MDFLCSVQYLSQRIVFIDTYIYTFPQTCPEFKLKMDLWCPPVRQKVASIAIGEVSHNGVTHFMTVNSGIHNRRKISFKLFWKKTLLKPIWLKIVPRTCVLSIPIFIILFHPKRQRDSIVLHPFEPKTELLNIFLTQTVRWAPLLNIKTQKRKLPWFTLKSFRIQIIIYWKKFHTDTS